MADVLGVGPPIPGPAPDVLAPTGLVIPRDEPPFLEEPALAGVIDDEIGFLNDRFWEGDHKTRIARFWSMAVEQVDNRSRDDAVAFGRQIDKCGIDGILNAVKAGQGEVEAYAAFDTPPPPDADPERGPFRDPSLRRPRQLAHSHGTAVLDLAAGGASEHPILAVELPQLATAETHGGRLDVYILHAALQILDWADTLRAENGTSRPLPVVVNISFAVHAGAKDGSGFLETELARLADLRAAPTYFVVTAGNNFRSLGRAHFRMASAGRQSVAWRVQPDDASLTFLEVSARDVAGSRFALTVPGVDPLPVPLWLTGNHIWVLHKDHVPLAAVYFFGTGATARLVVVLCPTRPHAPPWPGAVPAGVYDLALERDATAEGAPLTVSIETQRDDTPFGYSTGARQSYLDDAHVDLPDPETGRRDRPDPLYSRLTRDGTISAYGTRGSDWVAVVGGAYGTKDARGVPEAALYSSAGVDRVKPDVAAVSETARMHSGRIAAGLYSGTVTLLSGTSASAPLVTRAILAETGLIGQKAEKREILDEILDHGKARPAQDKRLGFGVLPAMAGRPVRRVMT